MPRSAKTPCRKPGCAALMDRPGFCDQHRREHYRQYNIDNPEHLVRNRFYQRAAWKRVRRAHLNAEPLCRHCKAAGKLETATVVDHIKELTQGGAEYDDNNLQSLCVPCHNSKTGRGG